VGTVISVRFRCYKCQAYFKTASRKPSFDIMDAYAEFVDKVVKARQSMWESRFQKQNHKVVPLEQALEILSRTETGKRRKKFKLRNLTKLTGIRQTILFQRFKNGYKGFKIWYDDDEGLNYLIRM